VAKLKEQLGEAYSSQVEKHAKQVVEDLKYEHMRTLTVNGGRIGARFDPLCIPSGTPSIVGI